MAVTEKVLAGVAVVSVSGKLMGGNETSEVQEKIKNLISRNFKKVVVDMSDVKWLNSLGIVTLLSCYTLLQNANGEMKMTGTGDRVNQVFSTTRLDTIFEIFESVDQAIASFKK